MIPLAKDTRETIGAFADKVENRSLLFEKMVLAKTWGHEARFDDANRFNVLRASTGASEILSEDSAAALRQANNDRAPEAKRKTARYKAEVAGALAGSRKLDNRDLIQCQVENSNNLLMLMERTYPGRVKTFIGTLGGRLLINMAGGVMENAGIALDRCFGLPYIPGSAVKGIARNAALWAIKNTEDQEAKTTKLRKALLAFGFIKQDIVKKGYFHWAAGGDEPILKALGGDLARLTEFKGMLSFLPAKPTSPENLNIVAEVITPHPPPHSEGRDPRPLFFPAVESGSSFGFAILIQRKVEGIAENELLEIAEQWLKTAITENGAGAKTSSGYGWFKIDPNAEQQRREEMEGAQQKAEEEAKRKADEAKKIADEEIRTASLTPEQKAKEEIEQLNQQEFAEYAKKLDEKEDYEQRAFLGFLSSPNHKDTRKRWKRNKAELWASLQSIGEKTGIDLL